MTATAPYGTWPSPLSPARIVEQAAQPVDTWLDGDDVYWSESRPSEGGRIQLVRHRDGETTDLLPEGFNARTRVHEYGGGAWWVSDGVVFFANFADQRVHRLEGVGAPRPVTPEPPESVAWRYADGRVVTDHGVIVCVREDHTGGGEARNEIVAFDADGDGHPVVLVSGRDFVASPRLDPSASRLAWIAWDHPNLPWDDTELWVADVVWVDGLPELSAERRLAGGPGESVMQPAWGPDGTLYVISDRSDWWNVYRVVGADEVEPVFATDREIGGPAWQFDLAAYGVADDGAVVMTAAAGERSDLIVAPPDAPPVVHGFDRIGFGSLRVEGRRVSAVAGSADHEPDVVVIDLEADPLAETVLRRGRDLGLAPDMVSHGRRISFPSEGGRTAHAVYYPPTNPDVRAPDGELPPLIVVSHGGPTSAARRAFRPEFQYWTTRGFAIVDVDYGGSTGYGRRYRQLLRGMWGVVDVQDCVAAARHLVAEGLVDPDRLAIRGGSAGGYTTLAALAFTDTFHAGANLYGVSDIAALMADTHKFERHYDHFLVGPMPGSEDLLRERSPIHHVEGFSCPLITFQGLEDAVVPPSQSEAIVDALDRRGIPHAYLAFEGEQHGFRRAETIVAVLDAELSFYGQVFGFDPPGVERPVDIVHVEALGT